MWPWQEIESSFHQIHCTTIQKTSFPSSHLFYTLNRSQQEQKYAMYNWYMYTSSATHSVLQHSLAEGYLTGRLDKIWKQQQNQQLISYTLLWSSTSGALCVVYIATDRSGWRAFAVTGPQLWNQTSVATHATSANISDCFKRALKRLLFQWVGVLLQMAVPLSNCYRGRPIAKTITLTLQWAHLLIKVHQMYNFFIITLHKQNLHHISFKYRSFN